MTTETFESWRTEAERILRGWYGCDPDRVSENVWRQCFERSYRPWEAARRGADIINGKSRSSPNASSSRAAR